MDDTSQVGHARNFKLFSYETIINVPITARSVSISDLNTGWKSFKQYLIVDSY